MADPDQPSTYLGSLSGAQAYATVFRGAIAFRYGPMPPEKAGEILSRCVDEQIPLVVTLDCGTEFDWELAFEMRGYAHQPMETAPRDGTVIVGVLSDGSELKIVWIDDLGYWLGFLDPDGLGREVEPLAWYLPYDMQEGAR